MEQQHASPDAGNRDLMAELLDGLKANSRLAELLAGAAQSQAPNRQAHVAADLLYGAEGIADFLYGDKKQRRKIYNLIDGNRLPHFRLGTMICARKSVLLAWIAAQETCGA